MSSNKLIAFVGILAIGLGGVVHAESTPSQAAMQSELTALKTRLAELEAKQNDTWLNERRAEEVKSLVREVLSDADTRASLLANGLSAGHNGKHFFLASEDGSFVLNAGAQIQFRYIYNSRNRAGAAVDENEFGFQLRRAKLFFNGHIGSPRITYAIGLQTARNSETVFLDHAWFGYKLMDGVTVYGGESKAPFLREELTSSKRQLAVERSSVNEFFTAGRVQGVWTKIEVDDHTKLTVAITDGVNSGEAGGTKDFHNDISDFALTARVDMRLAGQWAQMKDFAAWSGEETAMFVGGAFHWEIAETGDNQTSFPGIDDMFTWTIDGSIECEGTNLYAAIVGVHFNNIGGTNDIDQFGFVVQGGIMLIPDKFEPFLRWEWIDPDTTHAVNLVTVGTNYYLHKHNAKITTDLVWALNSLATIGASSSQGLLGDSVGQRNQVALRAQFQLVY